MKHLALAVAACALLGACNELVLTPAGDAVSDAENPFNEPGRLPGGTDVIGADAPVAEVLPVNPTGSSCAETGAIGCGCTTDTDCETGLCATTPEGTICTQKCVTTCPDGFTCTNVTEPPALPSFLCVPDPNTLCMPCSSAADCTTPTDPTALCMPAGPGLGSFCGATCSATDPCPTGYDCWPVVLPGGGQANQCRPSTGKCECTAAAVAEGATTPCAKVNEFGSCEGVRTCTTTGLSTCQAQEPAPEGCNGKDDDCDGETDEGFGLGAACDGPDADTCATGTLACAPDGSGTVCDESGASPAELCDGLDNDCDGSTDEDFPTVGMACTPENAGPCDKGVLVCGVDGVGTVCQSQGGGGGIEECNGKDDDCDGEVDEGFECKPGAQESDNQSCGACGQHARTRVCTAACGWGAWSDFTACAGEGVCTPGQPQTESKEVACGNCGKKTQQRSRTCSGSCQWGEWSGWTDASSCGGQGVCSPGASGASQKCGTCGTGTQVQKCSSSCQWTWGSCSDPNPCTCQWNNGTNWRCCGTHKWQFCLKSGVWSTDCVSFSDGGNQCP